MAGSQSHQPGTPPEKSVNDSLPRRFRMKAGIIGMALAAMLVAGGAFMAWLHFTNPVVDGRRMGEWIALFYRNRENADEAAGTIFGMEDRGVRLLLANGLQKDSLLQKNRLRMPGFLQDNIPDIPSQQSRTRMIGTALITHADQFRPHARMIGMWLTSNQEPAELQGLRILRYFPEAASALHEEIFRLFEKSPVHFSAGIELLEQLDYDREKIGGVIRRRMKEEDFRVRVRAAREAMDHGIDNESIVDCLTTVIEKGPFDAAFQALGMAAELGPEAGSLAPVIEKFLPTVPDSARMPPGLGQRALQSISASSAPDLEQ